MAAQISQQYAYRSQKAIGLVGGTPDYIPLPGFQSPDEPVKASVYSADGRLFACVLPTLLQIYHAESAQLLLELPFPNIIELAFSPRGTYLSTWERPVKHEDGSQHKNHRVLSTNTGEELVSFTQKSQNGWDLQYTVSESHAVRLVGADVQVFRPADWAKGVVDHLRAEGATSISLSPGLNPSLAVFFAEKKGQPASVKIFGLSSLNSPPTCQKTFFKADRAVIKWNTIGTQMILLTQTEVDNTNKSYYGETGMYLLSAAGNFDCRVTLDKEGPIHDFNWSPNSKEFGVVYGYMPAKTMIFDQRVKTLHDFGSAPHNFISFNPQGRLVLLAGFGNLAGKIDIFDRRTLTRVCTISAPNTSFCEWSACGRFILTATLSPRLRVDNGLKIWHCTGPLVHVQVTEELYQVAWRPTPVDVFSPWGAGIPMAPEPNFTVAALGDIKTPGGGEIKVGAYRPPGARGLATPAIFKREDEGGLARFPSGASTPRKDYSRGSSPIRQNGRDAGRSRQVPGAASKEAGQNQEAGGKKKRQRSKKDKMAGGVASNGPATPGTPGTELEMPTLKVSDLPADEEAGVPATPGVEFLDPVAKKARNLNKKLKAIDELKEKAKRGERLEATQLKKIDSEGEIRKELAALGATGE